MKKAFGIVTIILIALMLVSCSAESRRAEYIAGIKDEAESYFVALCEEAGVDIPLSVGLSFSGEVDMSYVKEETSFKRMLEEKTPTLKVNLYRLERFSEDEIELVLKKASEKSIFVDIVFGDTEDYTYYVRGADVSIHRVFMIGGREKEEIIEYYFVEED